MPDIIQRAIVLANETIEDKFELGKNFTKILFTDGISNKNIHTICSTYTRMHIMLSSKNNIGK